MKKFSVEKTSSKGFAIGKAYKFEKVSLSPDSYSFSDRQAEEKLFSDAVAKVSSDLEELAKNNEIFSAHLELVGDVALAEGVIGKIAEGKNVQIALKETIDEFVMIFESMDDEYMRQRADDIKDIYQRLLSKLKNVEIKNLHL